MNKMLLLVLCFCPALALGTGHPDVVWQSRYNNNGMAYHDFSVYAMAADRAGHVYSAGDANNGLFVLKTDAATGDSLWARVYRGRGDPVEAACGCATDSQGNVYITGYRRNGSDFDAVTMKIDPVAGDTVWTRLYNTRPGSNEYASACATDRQGNLYVVGACAEDTLNNIKYDHFHPLVIKYDAATGDTVWSRHMETPVDTAAEALGCAVDSAGYLYYVGYTMDSGQSVWLAAKLDPATGDTIWQKRFIWLPHNIYGSRALCCVIGPANTLYVGGNQEEASLVVKMSANTGDTIWTAGGITDDMTSGCTVDSAGDVYVVDVVASMGSKFNVIKYRSTDGAVLWSQASATVNYFDFTASCVLSADGLIIQHRTASLNYNDSLQAMSVYLVRFDPATGDTLWSCRRIIGDFGMDFGTACAADGQRVYVTGTSNMTFLTMACGNATGQPLWEQRYLPDYSIQLYKGYGIALSGDGLYASGAHWSGAVNSMRYDPASGSRQWASEYFGATVTAGDLAVDGAGYVYSCGGWYDELDGGVIIKYDPATGDSLWARSYQKDGAKIDLSGCAVDTQGFVYAVGPGALLKCDPANGDTVYAALYDGLGSLNDCAYDRDGFIYAVGTRSRGIIVVKFSAADGDTLWTRAYHDAAGNEQGAFGCTVDDSGSLYLAGYTGTIRSHDLLALKCGGDGDTLWSFRYDGPEHGDDMARGCAVDPEGNLYITGCSASGHHYDMVTLKLDTDYLGVTAGRPDAVRPLRYGMSHPWPNPANRRVGLRYTLAASGLTTLSVYNNAGQLVRVLCRQEQAAGVHAAQWDGRDDGGQAVSSGVYFIRIRSGGYAGTQKIIMIR